MGKDPGQERRSLRVFISSPDDVMDEREATRRVVTRLAREFRYAFDLAAVMWEWQPLLAGEHFQTQITPPRETDITVVIVWSRLGTPLPVEHFPGPLSGAAVTGTEWEFEDAIASMRAKHAPEVLVYRKRGADMIWRDDQIGAREEAERQLRLVEAFFQRWFASRPDGKVDVALRVFRATAEFEELVEAHLRVLLAARLGSGATPIRWHEGSPYRGLQSFEPKHAEIFFGRAQASRELRDRLERRLTDHLPFVTVLGASGSGKSSLVKAGLIPHLAAGSWLGGIGLSRHALLRPADDERDQLGALARALLTATALPELAQRGFASVEQLADLLRNDPASAALLITKALRDVASVAPPRAHQRAALLIVVDQLEELFTSPFTAEIRATFVRVLETLARSSSSASLPEDAPPILVVATMRSDFFGQLDQLPGLARLLEGDGQFLLLAPDEHEIGQMIGLPAQLAGVRFERDEQRGHGLDHEILAVAQRDTRVLPLLSFVLDQLWQRRSPEGVLTFDAYQKLGGLEGALAERAESVLASLPAEVQSALPQLLGALVHVAATQSAAEDADGSARFTASWLPLARFAAGSVERRLIDALLAPEVRLLVAEGDRAEARVRVAHEALLTHWQRARDLLQADRVDLLLIERLDEAESLWRDAASGERADRLLPSGLALSEAEDLLSRRRAHLAAPLTAFIEASSAAARVQATKRARLARRLIGTFATLAVIASVLGVVAWRQSVHANYMAQKWLILAGSEAAARHVAETQERLATQKTNDVLSLSAIQELKELVERADALWPAEPDMLPDYERWLAEARVLVEGAAVDQPRGIAAHPGLKDHEAKLAEIRLRAESLTPEQVEHDRKASPSFAKWERTQHYLTWIQRMLGVEPWPREAEVEEALAQETLPADANGLNSMAWPLVDYDPAEAVYGSEIKGLILARRALAMATEADRAGIRDTLGWALYRCGRLEEALAEEKRAVDEAQGEERDSLAASLALMQGIVAKYWAPGEPRAQQAEYARKLSKVVTELERDVSDRRTFEFQDAQDRWWFVQLAQLVADLRAFTDERTGLFSEGVSDQYGWGIVKRTEFARTIEGRSVSGAAARQRWSEAIDAIRRSPKYGGLEQAPQLGLLPIGMDRVSGLWEFWHIQSGDEPLRGADGKLLLTESMGVVLVLIPGGTFWMGAQKTDRTDPNYDPQANDEEAPVHEVTLSPYFLSKYEMTQRQWKQFTGRNPSTYPAGTTVPGQHQVTMLHPVESLSWNDAMEVLPRLGLALPTEAQWEYAARGGTDTPWSTGRERDTLRGAVNIADSTAASAGVDWPEVNDWTELDDGWAIHAPVGSFRPNAFGLHDIHGNVFEFCRDGLSFSFYSENATKDPVMGPPSVAQPPVVRGGAFQSTASSVKSASRGNVEANSTVSGLGLRPAKSISP